jgi:hypothetical protein
MNVAVYSWRSILALLEPKGVDRAQSRSTKRGIESRSDAHEHHHGHREHDGAR